MATTPRVHWQTDPSFSGFGSPFSEGSSESSTNSTSSLQYVNSQLVAHGFVHGSGLCLDGLGRDDTEKVVKCLLGMLSQRIDDMNRTEELSTKLRTLSYEHERLGSLYKSTTEKASNAGREVHTQKSRLASLQQALSNSENAHKRTLAELQRTRTSLQGLRATHQAEIKKLEKEKERVLDRWSKLADNQTKLGAIPSGIKFTNSQVVEASDVQLRGKGQGFLEVALEQAEQSRSQLADEVRYMRGLVISTANELQTILHIAGNISTSEIKDEPTPLSITTLFPLSPADAASQKITSLLTATREIVEKLARSHALLQSSSQASSSSTTSLGAKPEEHVNKDELTRLQSVIDTLREELDAAHKESTSYASQAQALFDRFAKDPRLMQDHAADISVDLMIAPARDEQKEILDKRQQDLDEERRKFTEATVKLGKERAALEAERIKLLEEKRQWQVQMMLADLPPTPAPNSLGVPPSDAPLPAIPAPMRSPRKSPRKVRVASPKKTRVSRRSSGVVSLSPRAKSKVTPAFETEVIPISPMKPVFTTSLEASPAHPVALPPAFVLPPPSPAATIGNKDSLLALPPLAQLEIPPNSCDTNNNSDSMEESNMPNQPIAPSSSTSSSNADSLSTGQRTQSSGVPSTPLGRRPFPMAKPYAQHMIHAYSPAKPSPLSRILMMASPDSPESSSTPPLGVLTEEDEGMDISPTPAGQAQRPQPVVRSLAAELGVSSDSDDDDRAMMKAAPKAGESKPSLKSTMAANRRTKPQAAPAPTRASRSQTSTTLEKENKIRRSKPSSSIGLSSSKVISGGIVKKTKPVPLKTSAAIAGTGTGAGITGQTGIVSKVKGGARRVPIESAQAAPTWRG
ncbi:hypothetical protein K474DRAFT_1652846 [Panus rudis PR-1116 ss-1]|nr:hypothetical protein K474DRAFT_1652846 [Panus rudis PR-1116 ss-1]